MPTRHDGLPNKIGNLRSAQPRASSRHTMFKRRKLALKTETLRNLTRRK